MRGWVAQGKEAGALTGYEGEQYKILKLAGEDVASWLGLKLAGEDVASWLGLNVYADEFTRYTTVLSKERERIFDRATY